MRPRLNLLLAFLLLSSSCSARLRAERQQRKEVARLQETAQAWWDAVRWEQPEEASTAYARLEARKKFLEEWMQGREWRVVDVAILGVETSNLFAEDSEGRIRTGKVLVRVEGLEESTQRVKSTLLTQKWYRTRAGWFLEEDSPTGP